MGKMKDLFIDEMNRHNSVDDTDWTYSNEMPPPPDEINLETGKCMWIIKDYRIWADDYPQALELLNRIESF